MNKLIDYRKSCLVHMIDRATGNLAFVIQVYGVRAQDLMTLPNSIVVALARKYPNHLSTSFMIEDCLRIKRPPTELITNNSMEGLF